jgi:hypothetical protein
MAIYGLDTHATAFYGSSTSPSFDVGDFRATPRLGQKMLVRWDIPTGEWTNIRLMRNFFGYARDVEDGVTLGLWTKDGSPVSFMDWGQPGIVADPTTYKLPEGAFVYYSLMLETAGNVWVLAGGCIGLVIGNYDSTDELYRRLPTYWREQDSLTTTKFVDSGGVKIPDPSGVYSEPLRRYLQLMGYELDTLRSEYDSLRWLRDTDRMKGSILAYQAHDLGAYSDLAIEMTQLRVLLQSLVYLNKIKGTKLGIEGAVTAYTSWGTDLTLGANLLYDSAFAMWSHEDGAPLNRTKVFESAQLASDGIQSGTTIDGTVPALRLDDNSVHSHNVNLTTLPDIRRQALRVTFGATYTVAVQALRRTAGAGNLTLGIRWWDADGVLLSDSEAARTLADVGVWYPLAYQAAVPADAVYATIHFSGSDSYLLRYASFTQGAQQAAFVSDWDGTYEHPREAVLALTPDRVNLVPNPSFEVNLNTWVMHSGGTVYVRDASQFVFNAYSVAVTANGTGNLTLSTTRGASAPILVGVDSFTASAYVKSATTTRRARMFLTWFNDAGTVLGDAYGDWVNTSNTAWVRPHLTVASPPGTTRVSVQVQFETPANGLKFYVDAVLLEPVAEVRSYFDANAIGSDFLWSGTSNQSPSLYYNNRLLKQVRLFEVLPRYLPPDRTFRLIFSPSYVAKGYPLITPIADATDPASGLFGGDAWGTMAFGGSEVS